ncbi:protoheme IX farnesyltransferase [bacterium]|nr:MAG: protoheme IX farnesyltransferase [bacterium]
MSLFASRSPQAVQAHAEFDNPVPTKSQQRFARYGWFLVAYTVLVILWGVYLRASGSGDGCGVDWPSCGGAFTVKSGAHVKTFIEYAHRASTMLLGVLLLAQIVWAFRAFPRRHPVRFAVMAALFFTLVESWVGKKLVNLGLVAYSQAPERLQWFAGHQVNTLLLAASFALTAWWATNRPLKLRGQGPMLGLAAIALLATLGLSVTGSVSALGDTLYPPENHLEVMQKAILPTANTVMKARPMHPYTAVVVVMVLCLAAGLLNHLRPSPQTRRFTLGVWFALGLQMVIGLFNVGLLAPIWMQVLHNLGADVLWLVLVLLSAAALAEGVRQVETEHIPHAVLAGAKPALKDFVALTKPRVISLLLFTTLTGVFIAAGGWPGQSFLQGLWLLVATGAGLYAAAGASNAINMVCERDLDVRMERTASRPTVTEKVHPRTALWFAFALEAFSFGILWGSSNLLAATLALAGLVVYVNVYTLLLKRHTWSNIVIGGAAGAFPPLVGFAAASGELSLLAWVTFALVFVWTPVHFWALAILIKDDYAKAGVPMLPVVKGDRYTVSQIGLYAIVTIACSFAPLFMGAGPGYGLVVLGLNLALVRGCVRLYQQIDRPRASSLFHYSMIYLALLFLALAIDQSGRWIEFLIVFSVSAVFYFLKFPKHLDIVLRWFGSLVSKPQALS